MNADDCIPMEVAAALAYGRLVAPRKPPSPAELKEQLALMATVLTTAIGAGERANGQVRVAALFEAIDRLRREAAAHSSEMMPR